MTKMPMPKPGPAAPPPSVQYQMPRSGAFEDTGKDSRLKDYLLQAQRMQHVLVLVGSAHP